DITINNVKLLIVISDLLFTKLNYWSGSWMSNYYPDLFLIVVGILIVLIANIFNKNDNKK
ncbi:hypothetical protein, partial [Vallitalea sediminicola]